MNQAADISRTVQIALAEDIGSGDITAQLIPSHFRSKARVIIRETAILCGCAWFSEVFRQLDPKTTVIWNVNDGDSVDTGQTVCVIEGRSRPILTGERTALNFLQTLSGTATRAKQYANAVRGMKAKILDTRKTIPGLRHAQKYAVVACGDCKNHRTGLYDGILIKENHIAAAGSIGAALENAHAMKMNKNILVEVEVESLQQLNEAIDAGAKRLLLDNMSLKMLRKAVKLTAGRALLEASGGVTLHNVRDIAETGVDFISVGDISKAVQAVDFSMRVL